jgi:hypothetical protein
MVTITATRAREIGDVSAIDADETQAHNQAFIVGNDLPRPPQVRVDRESGGTRERLRLPVRSPERRIGANAALLVSACLRPR